MSESLVEWLSERLKEDAQAARAARGDRWAYDRETFTVAAADGSGLTIANRHRTVSGADDALYDVDGTHIAAWDPARVLAEVAAKRRILALHGHVPASPSIRMYEDRGERPFGCKICAENDGVIYPWGWCMTVRLMAQPFELRDGYRAEWMPE